MEDEDKISAETISDSEFHRLVRTGSRELGERLFFEHYWARRHSFGLKTEADAWIAAKDMWLRFNVNRPLEATPPTLGMEEEQQKA